MQRNKKIDQMKMAADLDIKSKPVAVIFLHINVWIKLKIIYC